ncbi:MAG: hypothetical protein CMK29_05715 [Porticoccaceae bacterium]|nr:hypothetical protein [Porticoccaceae bacterium]OUW58373.1 MAG: hypothetical protein CBD57_02335 [Candidatus Pelagibacter sp. TMED197]|tara:strand:+ start:2673 stop:4454 length:1782 start_codon:yes stop_codon:yes gene_type:complete
MQITKYIVGLSLLILTTSQSVSKAETATSGNLLPNAGDGQSSYQNQSDNLSPDKVGMASGFSYDSGIQPFGNELEAKGEGIVSANGSLVGITTTKQSGGSFTTTENSLDGGVTLNSISEVQNCEWTGSSYQCGQHNVGGGQRDTYTNTIKILDANNNVLAITTFTRNNDAGYYGNTITYTDTVSYTDTGSRKYDWEWKGTDGGYNGYVNVDSIGPNLLGASLTATLLDIAYQPVQISEETEQEIELANLQLEEAQLELETLVQELEEINLAQVEEIETFEFAPLPMLELEEIEIKEIKIEEFREIFVENFKEILVEENLVEEFETALVEVELQEEQFFEEATNMVMEEMKEEFGSAVSFIEEEPVQEIKEEQIEEMNNEPTLTEEVKEEEPTETLMNEPKEEINETESTTTETMEETPNETNETGETSENVSTESNVAEDKETENETETESNEEGVESKETGDVKSDIRTKTRIVGIEQKVQKVIEKVMSKLKRVDQQLAAIQLIKTQGITTGGADLTGYINKKVYTNQKQLEEISFYSSVNIIEQSQIYGDKSLVKYTSNDPILQQQVALVNVQSEINTLRSEIYALKESLK